jgi:DNA-binding CsgD family transcriptional regulator
VHVIELQALGVEPDTQQDLDEWLPRRSVVFLGKPPGSEPLTSHAIRLLTTPRSVAFVGSEGDVARLGEIVRLVADGMFVSEMDAVRPLFARLGLFADSAEGESASAEQLSPRELEVLRLVAQGMDNRTIAERMVLSEGTIKAHVSHILAKVSVRTRAELVRFALTREIFPFEFDTKVGTPSGVSARMHQHITVRFTAMESPLREDRDPLNLESD